MRRILLFLFIMLICCGVCFADDWELAVSPRDEADLANGHKRKKAGDIIAVKPSPWEWGREEKKRYLFVTVTGLTKEEAEVLTIPYYENDEEPSQENEPSRIIAKRKYKVNLDKIKQKYAPEIDLDGLNVFSKALPQKLKDKRVKINLAKEAEVLFDKHEKKFIKKDQLKKKRKK